MHSYSDLISKINTGKYASVEPIRSDPNLSATVSKLTKDPHNNRPDFTNDSGYGNFISSMGIDAVSNKISDSKRNNLSMLQMFPETELSAQILISSILSPKDMIDTTLRYSSTLDEFPSDIKSVLLDKVSTYIETEYKLKNKLPEILKDILFVSGSYITVVIPESKVDAMINNPYNITTESMNMLDSTAFKGLLGNPKVAYNGFTMESMNVASIPSTIEELKTDLITITDNYDILKKSRIVRGFSNAKINNILNNRSGLAKEDNTDSVASASLVDLKNRIFKQPKSGNRSLFNYNNVTAKRKSIGKPFILKLNSESIIPVHVPGDPTDHVGYFVLLDSTGNPVNAQTDITQLNVTQDSDFSSMLMERAKTSTLGKNGMDESTAARDIFSDIIESELLARLKSGVYGGNVELVKSNEVYRLMLTRTLRGMFTKILYLPVEVVSYMNYEYHLNGVGKTLLDNMRVLNSLRAMVTFSRVMAGVKNSIGITEVKMKLDERDPDPLKSIELAMHEITKTRQQTFPVGVNTPTDIVDWVQKTGLEFSFEGHPKLPDMNFEFNNKANAQAKPDTELDEELAKRSTMALGLTPEMVENGNSAEFATTIIANNLLFSKRVLRIQETIIEKLNYLINLLIINDSDLIDSLLVVLDNNQEVLKENKIHGDTKTILNSFIDSIVIELPKPDVNKTQVDLDSLKGYIELIETALDGYLSSDVFTDEVIGEFSSGIDGYKATIRSYFIRKWLTDNNILSEFTALSAGKETSSKMTAPFNEQSEYMEDILTQLVRFTRSLDDIKTAVNVDVVSDTDSGGDDYSDDSGGGDDGTGDDGMDYDGMGDDGTGDDDSGDDGSGDDDTKNEVEDDKKDDSTA